MRNSFHNLISDQAENH